jgi:hypothetical protein
MSMDSFDNPATGEEEAAQEKEDTNAVPSPTPRDLALCRLGSAFYGSTPGAVFAALTCAYFCFMILTMGTRSAAENPDSKLRLLSDITYAIEAPLIIGGAGWSLRRVTAQEGELQLLGAGETKISARALRGLRRAHAVMWIPFTIVALLGLLCLVTATRVGTRSKITGNIITEDYARLVVAAGFGFLCVAFAVFPWWLTLKVAAVLAFDFVAEVRQAIERCSPIAPEWEAEVLPMVLTLTDETLPLLSRGWGAGIGMSFVGWWIYAAGYFCLFLETESSASLAVLIVAIATPLGMVSNVAAASSECDLLSDTLTEKRKRGPPDDLLYEHAVSRVEKILDRQNTKQGAGFVVFGRVVDTKSLVNIIGMLVSGGTIILPVFYSLHHEDTSTDGLQLSPCALAPTQTAAIRSVVSSWQNSSVCSYNISLSDIMAGL